MDIETQRDIILANRVRAGYLTQKALAEALGVHAQTISNIESGVTSMLKPRLWKKLARLLGVSLERVATAGRMAVQPRDDPGGLNVPRWKMGKFRSNEASAHFGSVVFDVTFRLRTYVTTTPAKYRNARFLAKSASYPIGHLLMLAKFESKTLYQETQRWLRLLIEYNASRFSAADREALSQVIDDLVAVNPWEATCTQFVVDPEVAAVVRRLVEEKGLADVESTIANIKEAARAEEVRQRFLRYKATHPENHFHSDWEHLSTPIGVGERPRMDHQRLENVPPTRLSPPLPDSARETAERVT